MNIHMKHSDIGNWFRPQTGFSIVEILVALVLSLILTLVVSQIYLSSKQSYHLQEAQSRLQENGRFALELLAKDIRRAGNLGCPSAKIAPVVIAKDSPDISTATAISGFNATTEISKYPIPTSTYSGQNWQPKVTSDTLDAVKGTDIFNIQFAEPCGGWLQEKITGMTSSPSIKIPSTNTCSIEANTELVLSDCGQIEVFRAAAAPSGGTTMTLTESTYNSRENFTYSHDMDAEVMEFHSYTYFIRMFNAEPTLYRQENKSTITTPTPQPVMEGVEDMQVLYGIDNDADGSVDQYLAPTETITVPWAKVIAVRFDLVLRSIGAEGENLTLTTTKKACNGKDVTDRRLRRCYSFTVNIRNPRT